MITVAEVYVAGLTRDNARHLIDRAHELGLPASVVRTVDGGFIVPALVAEDAAPRPVAPAYPMSGRSYTRKSAKNTTAVAVASEE